MASSIVSSRSGSVSGVIQAGVAAGAGNFIVSLANLGRDAALALAYGTTITVDAFFLALMIPLFMANVATGAYRNTIIPVLERFIHQEGLDKAISLINRLVFSNLPIVLGAGAFLAILVPFYAPFLAGRLPAEVGSLITTMTWAVLPMVMISAYASLAEGPLQALGKYFWPSLLRSAFPLGVALGAILWWNTYGIWGACYGGVLGSLVQLTVIFLLLPKRPPVFDDLSGYGCSAKKEIRQQFSFLSASVAMAYISPIIDQWMASFLEIGAVSALSYANRIIVGAAALAGSALSPALLSHFSRLAAKGRDSRFNHHYIAITRTAWWTGLTMSGIIWVISEPAVSVLYEHGSFTRADAHSVSSLIGWFCLQFPPMLAGIVGASLLSSTGQNKTFFPLSMLIAVVNVVGNLLFMSYYGLAGIALSTVVTYVVSLMTINIILVRRGVVQIHYSLLRDLVVSLATAVALGMFLTIWEGKMSVTPTVEQLLVIGISIGIYGIIAYVCLKEEIHTIWKGIRFSA